MPGQGDKGVATAHHRPETGRAESAAHKLVAQAEKVNPALAAPRRRAPNAPKFC